MISYLMHHVDSYLYNMCIIIQYACKQLLNKTCEQLINKTCGQSLLKHKLQPTKTWTQLRQDLQHNPMHHLVQVAKRAVFNPTEHVKNRGTERVFWGAEFLGPTRPKPINASTS